MTLLMSQTKNQERPFQKRTWLRGFAPLLIILTLLAVGVTFSMMAIWLSIESGQTALGAYQGERALALAESCAEDTLWHIRQDNGYSETSLELPTGTCDLSISTDGSERTISATGTVEGFTRTIEAHIDITPSGLTLLSWRETAT